MYKQFKYALLPGVIASTLVLSACGGGGSSDGGSSGSTDVVARGAITAIGSIWVNGVEWETPASGIYSDDDESVSGFGPDDIGKIVTLKGKRNDDGVSGTATEVEYEAEIEGAAGADNTIGTVKIITTETLTVGVHYEVSGYWIDDKTINATFIKLDDDGGPNGDDIDEIKGKVTAVSANTITVRGTTYNFSGNYADPIKTPEIGDYVEVHFTPGTMDATKVELEDDFMDDLNEGQEFETEGVVNMDVTNCPDGADFKVDDQCVKLATSVEWEDGLSSEADLADGIRVEVEGRKSGDLLLIDEVKGRGNEVRITAIPTDIGGGSFTFFSDTATEKLITVSTSDATDTDEYTLAELLDGTVATGVEVRGIRTDDGTGNPEIFAVSVKPEDADVENEIRAEIELDGADESGLTITVLGVTRIVDNTTQLCIDDQPTCSVGDPASFLATIDDNDNPSDGPNDIIDIEFRVGESVAKEIEIENEDD